MQEEQEHGHWADEVAQELLKRGGKQVIETGTSISGIPHIGNASDVIRADAIHKVLAEKGADVELIWVADDSDPFRKVPRGMEVLKDYLGYPVKDIPDPYGCHKNFVDHFVSKFVEELSSFGVKPTIYSGTELYRSGALYEEIRTALDKSAQIAEILNKFRTEPLPADYIPYTPICEKCGRISTAKAYKREGDLVYYVCKTTKVSGGEAEGCGHEGVADIRKGMGKMPWRVEWAARWHHFKVTCEPLGKEHASQGGSFWTSIEVTKKIFGWEPPMPVIYEFFTLNGEKISSSRGNVITLEEWERICEPEVLKFLMYKRLNKQRDINLLTIPVLVDEYDEAERFFFAPPETANEDASKAARSYFLSRVGEPKNLQVPFTLCTTLSQIIPDLDMERIGKKLATLGYKDFDSGRLERRLKCSKNWIETRGPENLKFKLLTEAESRTEYDMLSEKQKDALKKLVGEINSDIVPEAFHKRIYETARGTDLKPDQLFLAIYRVLIGKERGPKAASFLLSLDRDYIQKRFI
ncbi:MAG: lysine--tRNA ligase [Candidatus Altiarchaeia archaeon]